MIPGARRYKNAVLSFVLTLLILAGGFKAYQGVYNNRTIEDVKQIHGVLDASIEKSGDSYTVWVKIGKVSNFKDVYTKARDVIKARYGKYNIKVVDNRDSVLENIYYGIHFAIYEAAVEGNFLDMKREVDKELANNNLDSYKIFVDDYNVYVQLIKGSKYLYEIVPRQTQKTGAP
ncbi:hypothetical protein [Caldanaerobius polysaccharolyticus]|uniref:hypothetical protein n=1 Tax=Caldanaerobius polysaccharolyticus TaxID=44256 RepID=UPI00047E232F|nr:hypothetical protein [Caldanaerobius polysaccharolyticus]